MVYKKVRYAIQDLIGSHLTRDCQELPALLGKSTEYYCWKYGGNRKRTQTQAQASSRPKDIRLSRTPTPCAVIRGNFAVSEGGSFVLFHLASPGVEVSVADRGIETPSLPWRREGNFLPRTLHSPLSNQYLPSGEDPKKKENCSCFSLSRVHLRNFLFWFLFIFSPHGSRSLVRGPGGACAKQSPTSHGKMRVKAAEGNFFWTVETEMITDTLAGETVCVIHRGRCEAAVPLLVTAVFVMSLDKQHCNGIHTQPPIYPEYHEDKTELNWTQPVRFRNRNSVRKSMNSFWCYLGYYTMAYPPVGPKKKVHGRNLGNRGKREASDGTSPMPGAYEDGKILR